MVEEKTNGASDKQGAVSGCSFFLLFVGSWILFAFGVVGLYEDRELLSLDTVLAVVGLGLVIFSFPVLLRIARESEEGYGFGIGGGVLLAIWSGFKLARAVINNNKAWWSIGILVLVVISGIYQVVLRFRERRNDAEIEQFPGTDSEPANE